MDLFFDFVLSLPAPVVISFQLNENTKHQSGLPLVPRTSLIYGIPASPLSDLLSKDCKSSKAANKAAVNR